MRAPPPPPTAHTPLSLAVSLDASTPREEFPHWLPPEGRSPCSATPSPTEHPYGPGSGATCITAVAQPTAIRVNTEGRPSCRQSSPSARRTGTRRARRGIARAWRRIRLAARLGYHDIQRIAVLHLKVLRSSVTIVNDVTIEHEAQLFS